MYKTKIQTETLPLATELKWLIISIVDKIIEKGISHTL